MADVGTLFLEHKKLKKELDATAKLTQLQCEQRKIEVELRAGTYYELVGTKQPMCWCPVANHSSGDQPKISEEKVYKKIKVELDQTAQSFHEVTTLEESVIVLPQHDHVFPLLAQYCREEKLDLKLLYRGSKDDFTSGAYHKKCDHKGKLLILCTAQGEDVVIGGYNPHGSERWARGLVSGSEFASSVCKSEDCKCMVFSISRTKDHHAVRFGGAVGTRRSSCFNPAFGDNPVLFIGLYANESPRANYCCFQDQVYASSDPRDIEGPLVKAWRTRSRIYFTLDEIEVYAVA